jgi:NAD(P)-dependent dehydrogenase (short-subunit alcohol dehydrogenase family)
MSDLTETLIDPTKGYPKPPFEKQSQPWPGLARDMQPRPDHGEESYVGSGRLKNRKALITGGDSGMGAAAAIAFAREGADVVINYLPDEQPDADHILGQIEAAGRKGFGIAGDLRDAAFCLDITDEEFDATIKTNVYAPFWLIKAALPHLKPGSSIIGTTSEQATDPSKDLYDYAMTKAATTSYIRSLAKQLGEKGIRVNGVAPGPIWTPHQVSGGATMEKLEQFGGHTPLGRPGQPGELGGIYVRLAENDGSYATGQVYGAMGGGGLP